MMYLDTDVRAIHRHFRLHGFRYKATAKITCPWRGCTQKVQYKNLARHVRSIHLGVKFQCQGCNKSFTREEAIARHLCLEN
ncbi:hypothetical protein ID866_4348 [Astraeus odoratus]|nr:hypothetical protein ID866_4348 [Astraeus odoratus]